MALRLAQAELQQAETELRAATERVRRLEAVMIYLREIQERDAAHPLGLRHVPDDRVTQWEVPDGSEHEFG